MESCFYLKAASGVTGIIKRTIPSLWTYRGVGGGETRQAWRLGILTPSLGEQVLWAYNVCKDAENRQMRGYSRYSRFFPLCWFCPVRSRYETVVDKEEIRKNTGPQGA